MKKITEDIKDGIIKLYKTASILSISKKFGIGENRVKNILLNSGIEIKNPHQKTKSNDSYIEDNANRFPLKDGYHYVAISIIDGSEFDDYLNKCGKLIKHLKEKINGIEIPSLFKRKKYFHENGKQWHEQWFNIELKRDEEVNVKKCPYCNWETKDTDNKSGMFLTHLINEHNKTIEEYLNEFPEDKEYFKKQNELIEKKKLLLNKENYVLCPICRKKFEKLTYHHIKCYHGMEYENFKKRYPEAKLLSDTMLKQTLSVQPLGNLSVSKSRFVSKYEREIQDFLTKNDISFEPNRQLLIGKEIDILIESKKIGIEFDGLKWHTEWFGKKNHSYHLDKTKRCNELGYGLIHIFEDEYVNSKDIIFSKLSHILGLDRGKERAYGRKCIIKEIYKSEAEEFLNKYHIQGFSSSSIYLGAFYKNILVGVMTFKNGNIKNTGWELTRFATNYNYNCVGVGGKLFKYFIREYNPESVYSFADRRWTTNIKSNLYTKLGFKLDKITNPDYRYYNENVDRYKRIHKMTFSKSSLSRKYGFPMSMTEKEMAKELGYDRIWDCGLVKYVYKKEE